EVHAPNARDQSCRQKYRREHRQYVKVSTGRLFDLCPRLLEQELALVRELLCILDECRVAMDLAVEAVEFAHRKERRTLMHKIEHGGSLVGHVASDLYRAASHLEDVVAVPSTAAIQYLRFHYPEPLRRPLQQTLANVVESLE